MSKADFGVATGTARLPQTDSGPERRRTPLLAPYATRAEESAGRLHPEPACPMRTVFQRDRDRIVHATAFRRLTHKTQVFVFDEGDHYRTRLTHSLEVAQIARSIARMLALDEDLAEALALAHDLGHPPFGHAGERALAACMAPYGGFDHNAQSFKVVTRLERKYASFDGLNLSLETLEGLAKHHGPLTGSSAGEAVLRRAIADAGVGAQLNLSAFGPAEGQVAAVADDIAYNSHDLEDGLRAGLFALDDLAEVPLAGPLVAQVPREIETQRVIYEVNRRIITAMVDDVVREFGGAVGGARRPEPCRRARGERCGDRALAAAAGRDGGPAGLPLRQCLPPSPRHGDHGRRRDDRARSVRALQGRAGRDAGALARRGRKRWRGGAGLRGGRFRRRHDRPLRHQGAPALV